MHGGTQEKQSRSMMETSRCAQLMLIAAVNKLPEVWVSRCPLLFHCYYSQYFPSFFLR